MKEFDGLTKLLPDTQLIAEINKEYTLKGRMRKRRGLILFAVNPYDWTAKPVNITKNVVLDPISNKTVIENKAMFESDVIYEWAINSDRAIYKVKRELLNYIIKKEASKGNRHADISTIS